MPVPVAEQPFRTIIPRLNLLLRELDRRNRPAPGMAPDGNSQAVVLVERDSFRRPRPSVAEDHGLADKFGIGLHLANVRFAPIVLKNSKIAGLIGADRTSERKFSSTE